MPSLTTNHRAIEHQIQQGGTYIRCPFCRAKNRDDGEYVSGLNPGDPLCCDQFADAFFDVISQVDGAEAKHSGRMKQAADIVEAKNILFVEGQIHELMRGQIGILWCPYCLVDGRRVGNRYGNPEFCCFDLSEAVAGVLVKMELRKQMDQASRVAENADRLRECGVSVH